MKYIKLYEDYSDDSDISPIGISILNILKELQFIISTPHRYYKDEFGNIITTIFNKIARLEFRTHGAYFNDHKICGYIGEFDRDASIMEIFKVCNAYSSLRIHLTDNDVVEIIFNKYPQYAKYYEVYHKDYLSDEIKDKYSYLFKNELF